MMIKLSPQLKKQLGRLGVIAVYLFGSRAQGRAGPLSDFDFGVLLREHGALDGGQSLTLYDKLYDIFSPLCPRTLKNDIIDIVFLDSPRVPLELKFHVITRGKILFDRLPQQRADFESLITLKYADFQPTLTMFDRALLARL